MKTLKTGCKYFKASNHSEFTQPIILIQFVVFTFTFTAMASLTLRSKFDCAELLSHFQIFLMEAQSSINRAELFMNALHSYAMHILRIHRFVKCRHKAVKKGFNCTYKYSSWLFGGSFVVHFACKWSVSMSVTLLQICDHVASPKCSYDAVSSAKLIINLQDFYTPDTERQWNEQTVAHSYTTIRIRLSVTCCYR